jgi:hypothetical protein
MADKETPNERRLREEADLDKMTKFGIDYKYGTKSDLRKQIERAVGVDDGYGTSRSDAARAAGRDKANELWQQGGISAGKAIDDPRSRQAMREAAAEERRESHGMKKGGKVSVSKASARADGIAQRGKTRGKIY